MDKKTILTCVYIKCGISHKENSSQTAQNVLQLSFGDFLTKVNFVSAAPFRTKYLTPRRVPRNKLSKRAEKI